MRLFFSWQSDLRDEQAFLRACLQEICDDLDIEYDEDTRNTGTAEFVADVLLRKIKNCEIFVADLTPVGQTPSGKKLSNPNVCFETGFAERHHSRSQIVLIFNEDRGTFDDLPFDLSKRVSVRFSLVGADKPGVTKTFKTSLKKTLSTAIKTVEESQPHIEVVKLNKYEKSLLFWGTHLGEGVLTLASYKAKHMSRTDVAIAVGSSHLWSDPTDFFYKPYQSRQESLYMNAVTTLVEKGLLAIQHKSRFSLPGIETQGWVVTEEGAEAISQISNDQVFKLIETAEDTKTEVGI